MMMTFVSIALHGTAKFPHKFRNSELVKGICWHGAGVVLAEAVASRGTQWQQEHM